ncbi:hypothetical protein TNCV_4968261 [Trichonephila clavipes]|nr:hypothetical protein TNCV_4968261 [Trichonephila clavipes]
MHDAIRSGIEAYKFCMMSRDISFHIYCTLASSSFKLVRYPTRHPKLSQIYSTEVKSGDRTGQGRVVTVRDSNETPFQCEAEHCLVEKWLLRAIA